MVTRSSSRRRRRGAAIAVTTVAALALSACGGGDGGGDAPADLTDKNVGAMAEYAVGEQFRATEPLSFSILYSDHEFYPSQDDWLLWTELEKRTNVTFDPVMVPRSDYEEKRSLVIGAGDAPMIIPKTYPGQEEPFVASGAILPVSDYLHLMPNFQAKVQEWGLEAHLDTLRQADGKFYLLPGLHEDVWQDYTLAMRTDVLAELGLQAPTTWDEVRDVLAAIKQAYPDSYPLSDREEGKILLNMVGMTFGTRAGTDWGYQNATWDTEAGEFVFTGTMPEYKAMIEYLNSLVADGLLDPETFTQDNDTAIQKLATDRAFAISTNAQLLVNDLRPAIEGVPGATMQKITLPAGPAGNVINSESQLENGIMINADAVESENFVAMMQFIDWLWYSDEGQEFAKWGVEGVTYTTGADGTRVLADDVDYVGLNPDASKHLQKDFGFSGGVFAYGGSTDLLQSTFSEEELQFQALMEQKDKLPLPPPFPFTEAEREQATLNESALTDYVAQMTLQFILGQPPLSEWDAYVAELEGKGMGTYMDLVRTAHERYVAENG
ncbi:ABC transporter substrate-binding protein [Pseudonocardia nigra]|uniref:ABC transporter substrate-binding protein n=1 Tax=Pseudonocardia nigra TaxID=1921578 RepID=UPI001C5EA7E3|nr:extracellular solute-binding protein [Pseudonocardia nigra]